MTNRFLADLGKIDRGVLSIPERINYDMFKSQLEDRRDSIQFNEHLMPLNADSGFHIGFALLWQQMPFASAPEYDKYIARLRAFPKYVEENMALMREGLRTGMTIPRAALPGVEMSIEPLIADDPTKSPLWEPFAKPPATFDQATRDRVQRDGRAAIAEAVTPAYRTFLTFMTKEYLPGARTTLGATALPNGQAYYAYLVRTFTRCTRVRSTTSKR